MKKGERNWQERDKAQSQETLYKRKHNQYNQDAQRDKGFYIHETRKMLLERNNQTMKELIETKIVVAEITRSINIQEKKKKTIKEITQKVEQTKKWTI